MICEGEDPVQGISSSQYVGGMDIKITCDALRGLDAFPDPTSTLGCLLRGGFGDGIKKDPGFSEKCVPCLEFTEEEHEVHALPWRGGSCGTRHLSLCRYNDRMEKKAEDRKARIGKAERSHRVDFVVIDSLLKLIS